MPEDKICDTCGLYRDPGSVYECRYWETCVPGRTCSEWKEGSHPHNLLFRIKLLEGRS